jgi:hypothetical protein
MKFVYSNHQSSIVNETGGGEIFGFQEKSLV